MEYTLVKNEGTYEVEIHLDINEYDYPVACIKVTGWSNKLEDLQLRRYVETDIDQKIICETIAEIINTFEQKYKKYRLVMEDIDALLKSGSI